MGAFCPQGSCERSEERRASDDGLAEEGSARACRFGGLEDRAVACRALQSVGGRSSPSAQLLTKPVLVNHCGDLLLPSWPSRLRREQGSCRRSRGSSRRGEPRPRRSSLRPRAHPWSGCRPARCRPRPPDPRSRRCVGELLRVARRRAEVEAWLLARIRSERVAEEGDVSALVAAHDRGVLEQLTGQLPAGGGLRKECGLQVFEQEREVEDLSVLGRRGSRFSLSGQAGDDAPADD